MSTCPCIYVESPFNKRTIRGTSTERRLSWSSKHWLYKEDKVCSPYRRTATPSQLRLVERMPTETDQARFPYRNFSWIREPIKKSNEHLDIQCERKHLTFYAPGMMRACRWNRSYLTASSKWVAMRSLLWDGETQTALMPQTAGTASSSQ